MFLKTIFLKKQNLVLFIISTLLFTVYYILVNPFGLALSPDSSSYLQVANSLLNLEGFYNRTGHFIKHWPPLYSIFIALTAKLTFTKVEPAGLLLNGFTIIVSYIYAFKILRLIKLNTLFCYLIPLLMVISKAFAMSIFMLSESLFIAFELVALFYYLKWIYLKRKNNLIIFSILCALLILTRYAGVGIIIGFLIFELSFNNKSVIRGIKNCFIIGVPIIIGIAIWFTYIKLNTDSTEVRKIGIHVLSFGKFISIFKNIGLWFINKSVIVLIAYILFLISFIYYHKRIKLNIKSISNALNEHKINITLLITLSISYIIFLLISMLFFDGETPGSNRILSLIFPFLIFIIAILFNEWYHTPLKKIVYLGIMALSIGVFSNASPIWNKQFKNGLLYSSKEWNLSEITAFLNRTNKHNTYSNAPDFLNYKTKTHHYYLPFKITRADTLNTNYDLELNELKQKIKDSSYLAIYFNAINRSSTTPKPVLKKELIEFPITYFNDGFIIGYIFK